MRRYSKVIVLGLDGLEPTILERMLAAGRMPNLARLTGGNGVQRLATTCPAQTPVAWSTFATGTNPGGHGIFDFVHRDPATYQPSFALNTYERKNAFLPPRAVNLRRGETVWEVLTRAGIESVILRCPCTYPPKELKGRLLAGMGVPDIVGSMATPSFYLSGSDGPRARGESETIVPLVGSPGSSAHRGVFLGPRHPKTGECVEIGFSLVVDGGGRRARLATGGRPDSVELEVGKWSPWIKLKFPLGPFTSARGMARVLLVRVSPRIELYVSPVNFDPAAPLFPISHPEGYAQELERALGTFYTAGMVEDHVGLGNGRFDEASFLEQCEEVLRERERMMLFELERLDEGLLFCLHDTPDRLQHMFWRFTEPDHPANVLQPPTSDWSTVIENHYARCDETIGKVLEAADDRTLVLTLSDHGFGSFQRCVNLNTWLHGHGLLAYRSGVRPGPETGEGFAEVDWGRTKAYALGLGSIYLNRAGREAEGIVSDGEAPALKERIAGELTKLIDPGRNTGAVARVYDQRDIYIGPSASRAPDLVAGFARGYRASWATTLGGAGAELFEDNVKRWGGDHVVDPAAVPGFLAANVSLAPRAARMIDLAPTILAALGVPQTNTMEGKALLA